MIQGKIKIEDNEILEIFKKNITLHEASAKLNLTTVTLWRRSKKLGIKWSDKKIHRGGADIISLTEILEGKHPSYQTLKLKKRLLKAGIKKNKCEICGIESWNGSILRMQLDHIDGNSHNHKLENLRMICPNCHSQTETYCGKQNGI